MAIRDGRISAAGRATDVLALAGAGTEVWRLPPDLAVMPGITDAHLHLADAALAASRARPGGAAGPGRGARGDRHGHAAMVEQGDGDGWLLGHGWSLDALGRWPDAALLDRVAPGRPVSLWSHDHHSRWVSRAALAVAGIEPGHPDPPADASVADADGAPDGLLFEDAVRLLDGCIPEPDARLVRAAISDYARRLAAVGVVGVHDPGALEADAAMTRGPKLYREMAAAGELPLRVVASVREEQLERGHRGRDAHRPRRARAGTGTAG